MIIYLTSQGSKVSVDQGRMIIESKDGVKKSIPKEQIDSISCFGSINFTSSALSHCLTRAIPVSFFSTRGKYFGKLYTTSHSNIARLKQQVRFSEDPDFSLTLSKSIVLAKVNNQLTILRRNKDQTNLGNEINSINILRKKINQAKAINELIGYEGTISKYYFAALSKILPEEFYFKGRNRQPPKDPFNSLISLGYTILLNEISGQIESVGLNPYCGFLHQDRQSHPTLASDIIEEFRAPIVDSLAIKLCKNKFNKDDFQYQGQGCFLKDQTLKIYLDQLEKKMNSQQNYRNDQKPMTFRKTIGLQARDMVRAIEEENPSIYRPLWLR